MMETNPLWEILVPRKYNTGKPVRTAHHRQWDTKVLKMTGGLTIGGPVSGKWVDGSELYVDGTIPVRVMASAETMEQIAEMTVSHYRQRAVMYYKISDFAVVYHASVSEIKVMELIEGKIMI